MAQRRSAKPEKKKAADIDFKDAPLIIKEKDDIIFNPAAEMKDMFEVLVFNFDKQWSELCPSPDMDWPSYDVLGMLGGGHYGRVQLIKNKGTGKVFALKVMEKERLVHMKQVAHVHTEKSVLLSIKFPFVSRGEFACKDARYLYIAMPLIGGGDLYKHMRSTNKMDEPTALFYAAQLVLCLEFFQHLNLVYRDLKPENVMMDEKGYVKIVDFGFCKRIEVNTNTMCGTPEFMAPEMVLGQPYGTAVDWWSLGALIYEMVAGSTPFSKYLDNVDHLPKKIAECKYTIPDYFSPNLRSLVGGLMTFDTTKRIGCGSQRALEARNHVCFAEINWISLLNRELPAPFVPNAEENVMKLLHENENAFTNTRRHSRTVNRYTKMFENF